MTVENDTFEELLSQSSLGSARARRLRARTPEAVRLAIEQRAAALEPRDSRSAVTKRLPTSFSRDDGAPLRHGGIESEPTARDKRRSEGEVSFMEITHQVILKFATERVNLDATKAKEHRAQVGRLRERLERKIDDDPDFGLIKMLHSGSVAKGTALRSVNDLDVAVYVKRAQAPTTDPELIPWMAERLREANPQLDRSQFEEQDHSVKVNFRGSGLDVDVVPVLYEGEPDDRGSLIRKSTGERVLTSIPLHLRFIRDRKALYGPDFAQLVRLTKWWRRWIDLRFKSFMIELLWAKMADRGASLGDYPTALEDFFTYIVTTGLKERIVFSDFAAPLGARGSSAIEVIDPVNPDNNVAVRYDESERLAIVGHAQEALDALCEARFSTTKTRAVECWQVVLGPSFRGEN